MKWPKPGSSWGKIKIVALVDCRELTLYEKIKAFITKKDPRAIAAWKFEDSTKKD